MEDQILDALDEKEPLVWYESAFAKYFPFGILLLGIVFKVLHWPFSALLILIGLLLSVVRSFLVFYSRRRWVYEWCYFIGHVAGVAFLILRFFNWDFGNFNEVLVLVFIVGFLSNHIEWPKGRRLDKSENENEQDDDY